MVAHKLIVMEDGKRLNSRELLANWIQTRHSALDMDVDLWSGTLFPHTGNLQSRSEPSIYRESESNDSAHSLFSILLEFSPSVLGLVGLIIADTIEGLIIPRQFLSKAREDVTECGL